MQPDLGAGRWAGAQLRGGYAAYVLARAERARIADATDRRRRNLLRKELAWLRRGPPARTSKPRFRIEAANELIAGEPPPRDTVELERLATARLGKTVLDVADVTVTAGRPDLLDGVTWQLGPGERVGLIGPNGSGKSTLLDLLAGARRPRRACSGRADIRARPCASVICGRTTPGWTRRSPRGRRSPRCAARSTRPRGPRRPASCWTSSGCAATPSGRRRASCPAANGGGSSCSHPGRRAERAVPRRADQRPGRGHADRARGPAGRLARLARAGQPRPVLPGAGHRPRAGAARGRPARLPGGRGG